MSTETMDSSTQTPDQPELGPGPDRFISPRVEIDTSAPFASVEEAVIRFGGRGFWIPRHLLPSPASDESLSEVDVYKLEEQAAEMLKDLDTKQQETLNILNELELTKTLIEELKLKLRNEASEFRIQEMQDPANDQTKSVDSSNIGAGSVTLELNQAKQNLSRSTNDLEAIKASIKHANMKKKSLKRAEERPPQKLGISRELRELNYEAEQFMKTAEAAKAEVLKAMSDIEQAKTGLKMIEMRWVAARKMKEAAKAAEALALADIKPLSTNESTLQPMFQQRPGRITLSFEEYASLAEKARKAKSIEIANRTHAAEETPRWFNRSIHGNAEGKPVSRHAATSIGDILSRKLFVRDDLDIGRQGEGRGDGQRVSLNQMLDRHRTSTPPRRRNEKNNAGGGGGSASGGDSKGIFSKRKPFGFVHISLPLSKQSKNRIQALNLW